MSNCILYARCATMSNESIERQLTALRAHARLQRWSVVDEVSDNGVSGLRGDRPGLERVLAACKRGEVDIVLVQRLNRLSRSTTLTVKLIDTLKEYGIRLESPDGRLSGVPDVAEFQRDLAESMKRLKQKEALYSTRHT